VIFVPHRTQLESHLDRVKYEIAQEFGLTQRENREKQNKGKGQHKKFNINRRKKLMIK
jgi:hypothetical protein